MNSQFKNSNLGFIIYAALIGIIAAATFFMIWYMLIGYKIGTYQPDTRLGSVYIGGLRENEIFERINNKVDDWYEDEYVLFEIKYQDYSYELDRSYILFSLNTDLYDIENGQTNELLVSIQYSDQELIKSEILELPYLEDFIDGENVNIDIDQMILDMLDAASLMKAYCSLDVEDYIIDESLVIDTISSLEVTLPQGITYDHMNTLITEVYPDGKILLNEKELFDIIDVFGENMNHIEMNVLSTAMLKNIQPTNFLVNEVHYNTEIDRNRYTLDTYPNFGNNTVISETANYSFSFYNPNESTYYFELIQNEDDSIELVLKGLPFAYDISVEVKETRVGFITQTTTDPSLVNEEGQQGVIVEVLRTITDKYGNVLEEYDNELMIYEFYHPVHIIELEN